MNLQRHIKAYLENHAERKRWVKIVFSLALAVSVFTTALMTLPATAKTGKLICGKEEHTHSEECYESEPVSFQCEAVKKAHVHEESCYSEERALVCNEEHEHDDSCYGTVKKLSCDKEVFIVIHKHDEKCYDSEGNLICPLQEIEGHVHDDSCYEEDEDGNKKLICGKEELVEHPEHTEECYTVNENGEKILTCTKPLAVVHQHTDECIVKEKVLTCGKEEHEHTDACYAPDDKPLEVKEKEPEETKEEAVVFENDDTDVHVTVKAPKDAFPEGTIMTVTPVDSEEVIDTVAETVGEKTIITVKAVDITFRNGDEEVEPSGPISVTMSADPVEEARESSVVHIDNEGSADIVAEAETAAEDITFDAESFSVYVLTYTVDFEYEVNGQKYAFSMTGGDGISFRELVETLHLTEGTDKDAEAFMADIVNIEFSDPELVRIVRINNNSSLGALKEQYKLECEYPEILTNLQIEEINRKVFRAGDWALISLKPFSTPEKITVTMKKGEVFTIDVTDAQMETKVITADGTGYTITVTYEEDAGIPDGSRLEAEEIPSDTELYEQYLKDSAEELGYETTEDIRSARFFDIRILKDGRKIEPEKPVQVQIEYADEVNLAGGSLNIVHFAEEGTEVITDIALSDDKKEVVWKQESFSVTAQIVTNVPRPGQDGADYIMVIEDTNNVSGHRFYTVMNDGTLKPVDDDSYDPATNTIKTDYPITWSYSPAHDGYYDVAIQDGGRTYHVLRRNEGDIHTDWVPWNIRIHADARHYDGNQLADSFYFRYFSPESANGIDEETSDDWKHGGNNSADLTGHKWYNGIIYENNHVHDVHWNGSQNVSNGHYIGADFNNLHLTGLQSEANAATIHMARVTSIPNWNSNNESVSHIDIAISGNAFLDFPLAWGDYYDAQGNKVLTIDADNNKTLHLVESVPIGKDDIMEAKVYATDYQGNEVEDAFYITGYSANQQTGHSDVQVRMEGVFKVTTLPPWTGWGGKSNNDAQRRAQRLDPQNQITYRVVLDKEVSFHVIDEDLKTGSYNGQLYDANGNPLVVPVVIALTDGFAYWSEENECPPLLEDFESIYHLGNNPEGHNNKWWTAGAIIDNDWSASFTNEPGGGGSLYGLQGDSGMDFVLGNSEDKGDKVLAVEIVKIIEDENGHRINPADKVTNSFKLYYNASKNQSDPNDPHTVYGLSMEEDPKTAEWLESNGYYADYNDIREIDLTIIPSPFDDTAGSGAYYDYGVKEGMYYVGEDQDKIPKTIIDKYGEEWNYVRTHVNTEWVWRNSRQYDGGIHVVDGYSGVPEVLGDYQTVAPWQPQATDEHGNPMTNPDGSPVLLPETTDARNGFLEFYVYNIYTKNTKLEVEKIWNPASAEPEGAKVTVELYYAKKPQGSSDPFPDPAQNPDAYLPVKNDALFADKGITDTIVLQADASDAEKNWKGVFEELPKTVVDGNDNAYDVMYYAKETKIELADGTDVTDQYHCVTQKTAPAQDEEALKDGKVTFTNSPNPDLVIIKVDASDMVTPLPGAKFSISELADSKTYSIVSGTTKESDETGADGIITFDKLAYGCYVIEETQVPGNGYVKIDDGKFYIKVDENGISLITRTDNLEPKNWPGRTLSADDKLTYQFDTSANTGTAKVGNPPGSPLPSTGGSGTGPYMIGGILLIVMSVFLLARRKSEVMRNGTG